MGAPIRIFISHTEQDEALCSEFERHLAGLERCGRIVVWHRGRLSPGEERASAIREHRVAADVILLLVSAGLLASPDDHEDEVKLSIEQHAAGKARVIPILLRPCAWREASFAALQVLPRDGQPVTRWVDRDDAWTHVVDEIRAVIEEITRRSEASPPPGATSAGVPRLPPVGLCIGRDTLVDTLVAALLEDAPRPVPILGAAGIGKSTVSRAVLHRQEIAARYGARRWFVRLDAATTADALAAALAAALGLDAGPDPRARALAEVGRGPGLLVLDNFETPWESGDRAATEALLGELTAVPGLALLASVRGAARPGGVAWGPHVKPSTLDGAQALELFCEIAGGQYQRDPAIRPLLERQEGVPLAVTLLAHAAEGNDPVNLAAEWDARRTGLLEREGWPRNRLSSWAVSLDLSMDSPRMTGGARRLAALLAVLPDGIAQTDLDALLPGTGPGAARVLAQVGLAFFEAGRLRMLAPIREHMASAQPPDTGDLERAMHWYGELARTLGPKPGGTGGADAVVRLAPETANLDAVIRRGLANKETTQWVDAAMAISRFAIFSGRSSLSVLGLAVAAARAARDARREARCLESVGNIALARSQHDEARARYMEALPLFRQVGDLLGEGNCIWRLGDIALECSQHDGAHSRYMEALPLFRQVGSICGEANCIQRFGDIALDRSLHDEARARYMEALPLYRQVGDLRGEANCILSLSDIALRRSRHDEARVTYAEALMLFRQVGSICGEANCIQRLGDVALERSQHDEARVRYAEAQPLYRQVGDLRGEANCIQRLGDIALERSQHDEARAQYSEAQQLYRQVGHVLGEASCIQRLGDIALERSQHDEARVRYSEATLLFRHVGSVLGEAVCTQRLGDIALERSQHDEARVWYAEATALFQQVSSVVGEANCIKGLADITLALRQYDEARVRYMEAQPLYRQVGSVLGEANCIKGLADITLALLRPEDARVSYEAALVLYARIPEPYSIGQTHCCLARLPASLQERRRHVEAARAAWLSIDRPDLVAALDLEFAAES